MKSFWFWLSTWFLFGVGVVFLSLILSTAPGRIVVGGIVFVALFVVAMCVFVDGVDERIKERKRRKRDDSEDR